MANTPASGGGGGGRRRRTAVRLAFASVLVLVVVAALALLEVGVGLRWSGSGGAGGLLFSLSKTNNDDDDDDNDNGDTRAARGGAGGGAGVRLPGEFKRAYAVVFPDVHDPLVLERAFQLRDSLEAMMGDKEDIVAIVPRFIGRPLVAPLQDAGYRVLQRETPAPPWRASGRFTQQAITAIGTGWESGDAGGDVDGGGKGGGGHGWGMLALEALSLVEYEEVVVLDQKMVIFEAADDTQGARTIRNSGRGSEEEMREDNEGGDQAPGHRRRWRHLSGGGGGDKETDTATNTLPSLVPRGGDWTVAFAPGDGSGLALGPGLSSLSAAERDRFSVQHAALLAVRPDAELYARVSGLLCEGDSVFSDAYPGIPDKDFEQRLARDRLLERRAGTIPLLHLAVASIASRDHTAQAPLEVCGGLSEAFGTDQDEQAGAWKWTGAASPVVWCPSPNSRQQPDRNASVDNSAGSSAGGSGASSVSARRTQEEGSLPGGQEGGGAGSVGGEGEGEKEGVQADVEEQRDEKQRADQPEDGQEHPETGEGGAGSGVGTVRLAWIPGDPCSCVDAPGMVGEACRSWLITRAAALSSRDDGEKTAAGAEAAHTGQEARDDLHVLALSDCKDGALVSPLPLPASPAQQAAHAAATAGAAHLARRFPDGDGASGSGGGDAGGPSSSPPPPPPPLWQTTKPARKAEVKQQDLRNFQHFWLANVEKKVLMVAIPKVACTQVHALFLRLQGSKNWNSPHMQEIHYHQDMDKYKMSAMRDMTPERASSILNDPAWTKGVFLRDPAERLLSCFLDKIVHRKSYSVSVFGANDFLSFEKFVALTSKGAHKRFHSQYPGGNLGLTRKSNPHWRPQLFFGLDKFLPYFDFVGDFKHVGAHSEAFLKRAGLWDEFGASGWGPTGGASFFQRTTVQGHATGSRDSKGQYYTPPLLASVREAYAPTDYKMLASLGWWNETVVTTTATTTSASSQR